MPAFPVVWIIQSRRSSVSADSLLFLPEGIELHKNREPVHIWPWAEILSLEMNWGKKPDGMWSYLLGGILRHRDSHLQIRTAEKSLLFWLEPSIYYRRAEAQKLLAWLGSGIISVTEIDSR